MPRRKPFSGKSETFAAPAAENRPQPVRLRAVRFCLHVEQEIHDVAVVHDILLALAAQQALCLRIGQRAAGLEIVEGDDLGADEAALKVGMDLAGGLRELQERADGAAAVNAGRNWSAEEEARLLQEYGAGLPIETIAHRHGRSVGAIETRLSELGQRDQIQFSMR